MKRFIIVFMFLLSFCAYSQNSISFNYFTDYKNNINQSSCIDTGAYALYEYHFNNKVILCAGCGLYLPLMFSYDNSNITKEQMKGYTFYLGNKIKNNIFELFIGFNLDLTKMNIDKEALIKDSSGYSKTALLTTQNKQNDLYISLSPEFKYSKNNNFISIKSELNYLLYSNYNYSYYTVSGNNLFKGFKCALIFSCGTIF